MKKVTLFRNTIKEAKLTTNCLEGSYSATDCGLGWQSFWTGYIDLDVEVLDINQGVLREAPELIDRRIFHGSAVLGKKLQVYGGLGRGQENSKLEVSSFESG